MTDLRDSFQDEADKLLARKDSGKWPVVLAATADKIGSILIPTKVWKEDIVRIVLQKRDNVLLKIS